MRILFPLPGRDFDPTEAAVPWNALVGAGHSVVFATPDGTKAAADRRILTGRGFGPFRPFLRATPHGRRTYEKMAESPAFGDPVPYGELRADAYDGVMLTGGHAPGMRPYLESEDVQRLVADHMAAGKPVGAICHGVLVVARAKDPTTGRSVLYGRKTTGLMRSQELTAWGLTRLWLGSYYRTYPETVQDEVTRALEHPGDFRLGPFSLGREHPDRPERGFTVRDGNYLSARFYGDAYRFAADFVDLVAEHERVRAAAKQTKTA